MPMVALVANKHDMRHLAVVKPEQHNCFAEENGLSSFLMSAKNGDQVTATFLKIGCQLAGLPLGVCVYVYLAVSLFLFVSLSLVCLVAFCHLSLSPSH